MGKTSVEQIMQTIADVNKQVAELTSDSVVIPRVDAINTIRKVIGDTYLRYLFNLSDSNDIERAMLNAPHDQIQKLTQIVSLLTPILLEQPDLSALPGTFCRCLGSNLALQDEFRISNGGNLLRLPKTGDDLQDSVLESVQRIAPTLTMTEWGERAHEGTRIHRLANYFLDDMEQFEHIVNQEQCVQDLDIKIKSLDIKERQLPDSYLSTTSLAILPFTSLLLREGLISSALYYANTLDYKEQAKLLAGTKRAVTEFRNLLSLQTVTTTTLTVLDGAIITDDKDITTAEGILRKPTEYEQKMIMPPNMQTPLIFEADCDNRLLGIGDLRKIFDAEDSEPFADFRWFGKNSKTTRPGSFATDASTLGIQLQAAMILASNNPDACVAHICGYWAPVTFSSMGFIFNVRQQVTTPGPPKAPIKFSTSEFQKWFDALTDAPLPDITLSRLVEAFSDARNNKDALDDLLIVVETIFGAKNETVFKLSVCTAKLLSPTDEITRHDKYKEMRDAYSLRSDIVHGNKKKYNPEREKEILDSLRLNVKKLLKTLLSERTDILFASQDERIKKVALS